MLDSFYKRDAWPGAGHSPQRGSQEGTWLGLDTEKDRPASRAERESRDPAERPDAAAEKPWAPVRVNKPYGDGKEKREPKEPMFEAEKSREAKPPTAEKAKVAAEESPEAQPPSSDDSPIKAKARTTAAPTKKAAPVAETRPTARPAPGGPPRTRTERAREAKGKRDLGPPKPAGTTKEKEKKKLPTLQVYARRLCLEIGARPAGSTAEHQAADFIERVMSAKGAPVTVDVFRTEASAIPLQLLAGVMPLAGVVVFLLSPALAFVLVTLGFLAYQLHAYRVNVLRVFQGKHESANIVSRIEPSEQSAGATKVVLLSHYDSPLMNQSRLPYADKLERFSRGWSMATLGLLFVLYLIGLALYVLKAEHGAQHWIWIISLFLILPSLAMVLLLTDRWWRGDPSPGANDNASGTAVLLALQRHYWRTPPRHVEFWFAATGAGAAGSAGIKNLLREHRDELGKAYFINIEEVGRRQLLCLKREGAFVPFSASRKLLGKAKGIAFHQTQLEMEFAGRGMARHQGVRLMAKRRRALTVTSCPKRRTARSSRPRADDYDGLDIQTLRKAYEFVQALLENLDHSTRGDRIP